MESPLGAGVWMRRRGRDSTVTKGETRTIAGLGEATEIRTRADREGKGHRKTWECHRTLDQGRRNLPGAQSQGSGGDNETRPCCSAVS
jgi:hypothetical protein